MDRYYASGFVLCSVFPGNTLLVPKKPLIICRIMTVPPSSNGFAGNLVGFIPMSQLIGWMTTITASAQDYWVMPPDLCLGSWSYFIIERSYKRFNRQFDHNRNMIAGLNPIPRRGLEHHGDFRADCKTASQIWSSLRPRLDFPVAVLHDKPPYKAYHPSAQNDARHPPNQAPLETPSISRLRLGA